MIRCFLLLFFLCTNLFSVSNNTKRQFSIFDIIKYRKNVDDQILAVENYLHTNGNINIQDSNGNTLLMLASYRGNYDLVSFILYNDADINITNNMGQSAIMFSASYPYILQLFFNYIKNIDEEDNHTKTLLMYASASGELLSVKLLLENNANIHKRDINGKTTLMYAIESSNIDLVKYLIEEEKLDINEKDDYNQNGIFYVRNIAMARYLIDNNIDYTNKNLIGLKASEVLRYSGYTNVSTYLRRIE